MKQKYYHASKKFFKPGDLVLPGMYGGVVKNYNVISRDNYVYLTSSPAPHFTILARAIKEDWIVYEVKPQGKIGIGNWDDFTCDKPAIVIKRVGSARGLAKKHKIKSKDIEWIKELKNRLKDPELDKEDRERYKDSLIDTTHKSSSAHTRSQVHEFFFRTKK